MTDGKRFREMSATASIWAGSPLAFVGAVAVVVVWVVTGPVFGFSDTWQLVINTGTTIVTFLMVFLIQNSQNRDVKSMQLKLDELIRVTGARNALIDVEEMSDDDLKTLENEFKDLHQEPGGLVDDLRQRVITEHERRQRGRPAGSRTGEAAVDGDDSAGSRRSGADSQESAGSPDRPSFQ